jgi:hypothetical protein
MTAKLYHVTITQIWEVQVKVAKTVKWVAATSPKQAKQKALNSTWKQVPDSQIHVAAQNFQGGVFQINYTELRPHP